jgi:hypothetical protein
MKKIVKKRTKANGTTLPSHHRAFLIGVSSVGCNGGSFGSAAKGFLENADDLLENADSAEVSPEFIGIPPLPADLTQQGHPCMTRARRSLRNTLPPSDTRPPARLTTPLDERTIEFGHHTFQVR